ncbi:glucuronosyltransferase [Pseudoalteromonas sp. S3785]|uniref:glycosyltransferase n=1 Tax=Pseudoalteromonas sp. S3785 TaxID=579545 RepID=UPI00110A77A9|nr:glycosyltransferase [Pseudoalteromonas sp. S3785]TMO75857.1 glucuronosyltransferase [Pseudoalteromonas sp. S3785]
MKVLVSVGAQLPFKRLIEAISDINKSLSLDVFAQVGEDSNTYDGIQVIDFLSSNEYKAKLDWCDIVIAHAGMGTIIQCLELNKKLIVVPRLAKFGEHRNDHQLDTISRFEALTSSTSLMRVCRDIEDLEQAFEEIEKLSETNDFFTTEKEKDTESLGIYIKKMIDDEV